MCIPAAAAVTVAGSALSAAGQVSAANYNARAARAQAAALDASARDAEQRGRQDAEAIRQAFGQTIGQQRAGFAAANVDLTRGSAAAVTEATAAVGELETLRTLNNAAREAWGLRAEATAQRASATISRRLGYLNAGTTLLSGAVDGWGITQRLRTGGRTTGVASSRGWWTGGVG